MNQEKIIQYIADYKKEKGYSPSMREIGEAMGGMSASHVQYWLRQMVIDGRITYQPRQARTIQIIR